MPATFSHGVTRIFLLLVLALFLAGCGGSSSGGGGGRGLSEIMTKKDVEEQEEAERRRGEGETQTRTHSEPVVQDSGQEGYYYFDDYSDAEDDRATYEDVKATASFLSGLFSFFFSGGEEEEDEGAANYRDGGEQAEDGNNLWFGFRYSWTRLAGDVIQGIRTGEVRIGLRNGTGRMGYVGLSVGQGTLDRDDLEAAISDLGEFGLTIGVTSFLTPASSPMGITYDVGLRFGEIVWDYREAVPVDADDGGELLITEDSVFEGGAYVGLGLAIIRTEGFHLGGGVLAGMRWRSGETTEGFSNDLFQNVGYYQLNLEAVLHF